MCNDALYQCLLHFSTSLKKSFGQVMSLFCRLFRLVLNYQLGPVPVCRFMTSSGHITKIMYMMYRVSLIILNQFLLFALNYFMLFLSVSHKHVRAIG